MGWHPRWGSYQMQPRPRSMSMDMWIATLGEKLRQVGWLYHASASPRGMAPTYAQQRLLALLLGHLAYRPWTSDSQRMGLLYILRSLHRLDRNAAENLLYMLRAIIVHASWPPGFEANIV